METQRASLAGVTNGDTKVSKCHFQYYIFVYQKHDQGKWLRLIVECIETLGHMWTLGNRTEGIFHSSPPTRYFN